MGRAIGGHDASHVAVAFYPFQPDTGEELDAFLPMDRGIPPPDLRAEHTAERHVGDLEHGDVAAHHVGAGRHLGADEAGTDDDDPCSRP